MDRIETVEPSDSDEGRKQAARFEALTGHAVQGPFRVWAAQDGIMSAAIDMLEDLRAPAHAPAAAVKIGILVIARHNTCQFEWRTQSVLALKAGVSETAVEAIRSRQRPPLMTVEEAIAYDFSTELMGRRRVSPQTFERAVDVLGRKGLSEFVTAIGFYEMVALVLNAYEVFPPDETPPLTD